ncbi:MAG: hypothetical protein ICV68_01525 [Pyrinomonadaceae bacterium]|nr:hypothetical protein [Pyrinomonadaceae bacterium]
MMILPPYSIEEFWKIVAALANDLRRCTSSLEAASKGEDAKAVQSWRRLCAHVIFASLESATYHMLYTAHVERNSRDAIFSADETERLEKAYDFSEDNQPEASLTPEQRLDRIKFAFDAFARVHCCDYLLLKDDPDWLAVKDIFLIEKRLLHPQTSAELNISDDSVTNLLGGTAWIMKQMVSLLESSEKSMEDRAAFLKEEKDELIM